MIILHFVLNDELVNNIKQYSAGALKSYNVISKMLEQQYNGVLLLRFCCFIWFWVLFVPCSIKPRLHDTNLLAQVKCRGCARRRFMQVHTKMAAQLPSR
jgi:hypothetical protein